MEPDNRDFCSFSYTISRKRKKKLFCGRLNGAAFTNAVISRLFKNSISIRSQAKKF